MPVTISSLSTEYVQILVEATANGVPVNPSSDQVTFAFIAGTTNPQAGDWKTGSWDTDTQGDYLAQCLIGPDGGTITLTPGAYYVWIKITDNPEVPIRNAGYLIIT